MELVALVGNETETLGQIAGLIKKGDWDKVILVGENFDQFSSGKPLDLVRISLDTRLIEMRDDIRKKIKGKITGTEVALSIASGSGKEHMALISALLTLPVGIRFTALTKDGIIEL